MYKSSDNYELMGYCDSDWGGCLDDMKSTTGDAFQLGSNVISWSCKKQDTVAQSTIEAEYISASSAINQAIWMRKVSADLNQTHNKATIILCDNKSVISMAKDLILHGKTKYIKIKYHFIKEAKNDGEVSLLHCNSNDQVVDILTKPLARTRFDKLNILMRLCSRPIKEECYQGD